MFGKGKRDYSVDTMRCISCFMVVCIHVSAFLMSRIPFDASIGVTSDWFLLAVMKNCTVSATNLFLMISGIFFLSSERNVSISKVWSKNILKLASAYVAWCVIYALYRIFVLYSQPFSWGLLLHSAIDREFHLWYIPMMLGIYVVVPLMRVFTETAQRRHYRYIIGLMIGAMTLNTIRAFNGEWPYPESDTISTVIDYTPTDLICQYPFYCILGYYLYTYRPKFNTRILLYILGILGLAFEVGMTVFFYVKTGNMNPDVMQEKFIIGIFAKNTAIFIFVLTVFSKINFNEIVKKVLSKLSAATLFIYLSHILGLYILLNHEWLLNGNLSLPVVACIYVCVIYFSSFVFSLVFLQTIPWVRMRNVVLDEVWPNRKIWNGGRKRSVR